MENINIYNKLYKEAQNDLNTSVWSLKFEPDYLSAVVHFTEAANGYKKLAKYTEAINAYEQAIKCNKHLHECWAEGQNWSSLADIYLNLNNQDKVIYCIKNASLCIKISGKIHSGIRVYIDFANKLLELNNSDLALKLLLEAYNDTIDNIHEDIIRVGLDDIVGKIIDIYSGKEMFKDAIVFIDKLINIQKGIKEEKKYKITKNYIKLAMLMIINNEAYMVDGIINNMYTIYDTSCGDDIEDLKELYKAFNEVNKRKFGDLITYSFSLFQNNLLKALKKSFDTKLANTQVNTVSQHENNTSQPMVLDLNETNDTFQNQDKNIEEIYPNDEYL